MKVKHKPASGVLVAALRLSPEGWDLPDHLPVGLPPVDAFTFDLLPDRIAPWVRDIVERFQCAPEFVAVPAMVALGSLIGRQVAVRPQEKTDWTETANQWAILVGRPGTLKSPAMEAALAPLNKLAAKALKVHKGEAAEFKTGELAAKLRADAAQNEAKKILSKNRDADVSKLLIPEEEEDPPALRRYKVIDPTIPALVEVLRHNPNGVLAHRDELVSLLKSLDREDNSDARGFYLSGWNGNTPYTSDRILRGLNLHIDGVCLSMLGSTQPGRLSEYIRAAVRGGAADDGLIQRFGMLVWPDTAGEWRDVDRAPDTAARIKAEEMFEELDEIDLAAIGATQDQHKNGDPDGLPFLRYGTKALRWFRSWREDLEKELAGEDIHPALESHYAKYRKLVPGLSLVLHLASGGTGPIEEEAVTRAIRWAELLKSHAIRAYGSIDRAENDAAEAILYRIRRGDLPLQFSSRDVWHNKWSRLSDTAIVHGAIALLVGVNWLAEVKERTAGRTKTTYHVNPMGILADAAEEKT